MSFTWRSAASAACRTWSNTFAAGLRSVVAPGVYEARKYVTLRFCTSSCCDCLLGMLLPHTATSRQLPTFVLCCFSPRRRYKYVHHCRPAWVGMLPMCISLDCTYTQCVAAGPAKVTTFEAVHPHACFACSAYLSQTEEQNVASSNFAPYDQYEVSIPMDIAGDCLQMVRHALAAPCQADASLR